MNVRARNPQGPFSLSLAAVLLVSVGPFGPDAAAAGFATIYVAPHVPRRLNKLLGERFNLTPFSAESAPTVLLQGGAGGIVLGSKDLDVPELTKLAREAYGLGLSVAIADADAEDTERLRAILSRSLPIPLGKNSKHSGKISLLAVREEAAPTCCRASTVRTHIMKRADRKADSRTVDWLEAVFRTRQTSTAAGSQGDVQNDLTKLANSTLTDQWVTNKEGSALQVLNEAWAARSFVSNVDYYYVQQWVTIANSKGSSPKLIKDVTYTVNQLVAPFGSIIIQAAPGTTQNATTYTSGVSFSTGATAGYNAGNILTAMAGLTISNSTSTTVAPTQIKYQGRPEAGMPIWKTITKEEKKGLNAKSYSYTQNWIWAVPFDSYEAGQTSISYLTITTEQIYRDWSGFKEPDPVQFLSLAIMSVVPLPFNQTQLAPPSVTGVSTLSASPGDVITVTGANFYLLNSVLIGGNPVPESNYSVVESDTSLQIIIPANQPSGPGQSIVINTDEGLSNSDITLTIN